MQDLEVTVTSYTGVAQLCTVIIRHSSNWFTSVRLHEMHKCLFFNLRATSNLHELLVLQTDHRFQSLFSAAVDWVISILQMQTRLPTNPINEDFTFFNT